MDGVDAALVRTDGERIEELGPSLTLPYPEAFRARLRGVLGLTRDDPATAPVEAELGAWHAEAVERLLVQCSLDRREVDIVGFHGQTIHHAPARRLTVQLGNGVELARKIGIPVAWDFRSADVAAGG
mgnify:FL=1